MKTVYHYVVMLYCYDSTDVQTVYRRKRDALEYIKVGAPSHTVLRVGDGHTAFDVVAWTDSEGNYHEGPYG